MIHFCAANGNAGGADAGAGNITVKYIALAIFDAVDG